MDEIQIACKDDQTINKTLKEIEDIEKLQYTYINVLDYSAYPTLKVEMVS